MLEQTVECGYDLNKSLWLQSANAEQWLTRRANYSRSL